MGGCQEWDTHARAHARTHMHARVRMHARARNRMHGDNLSWKSMGTIRHGNLWGQFVTEIYRDNLLQKTKLFRNELT